MAHVRDLLEVDLDRSLYLTFITLRGDGTIRLPRRDYPLVRALREIELASIAAGEITGVLKHSNLLRKAVSRGSDHVLYHIIENDRHQYAQRVAIWILGRTCMTFGLKTLTKRLQHSEPNIRREATRALRRMRSWEVLSTVLDDPDTRIGLLATPRAMRPLPVQIDDSPTTWLPRVFRRATPGWPSPQSQQFSQHAGRSRTGKRPKSRFTIRGILHRIRALVGRNS